MTSPATLRRPWLAAKARRKGELAGVLIYEAWGEHEAILLRTRPEGRPVPEPEPSAVELFSPENPLRLESGEVLETVRVRYETYGQLAAQADNAIFVFHALTGSAHLAGRYTPEALLRLSPLERAFGPIGWWDALVGEGRAIDTSRFFVISANVIGSCYGTTGPLEAGPDFPELTVRDMVKVHAALLDHLNIERIWALGGSLGGMQALEFAAGFPDRTRGLVAIAAPARHSPWARGLSRVGREAILRDPAFAGGHYQAQPPGLALAREIAMLSYRAPAGFASRFGSNPEEGERYLAHQGEKFIRRFDANSYLALTGAMDRHDLFGGRSQVEASFPKLLVGIDSDLLYPASEVRELAQQLGANYQEISSPFGHDGFLIENDQMGTVLRRFLASD